MAWRVLVSAPYFHLVLDRFRPLLEAKGLELVVPEVEERLEEDVLLTLVGDIDAAICGDDRFTARVLERAVPRLKVISKWGTGIDSIDQAACARLGVRVCNTPNAFSEPVADSALGYMLCFARKLPWMDRQMKAGIWDKIGSFALNEATLGIIGVGNVGKAIARRAVGFGMRVLGNDLVEMPGAFLAETGVQMVDKDTLYRESDFVSVNCDLNPTSRALIDRAALAKMKPTAVLLNLARGPIHVEADLIAALQAGGLAGAALDVFEHEPLPTDSPLRALDQVMIAPHNSNSSPLAWERVHHSTIENMMAVLTESAS